MPSLITHQLFAIESIRNNIPTQLHRIITCNMEEFNIGANGPDLFFYCNAWPWLDQKKAKEVADYGGIIHRERINDFFKEVFINCKNHQTQEKISYISGLLCHLALDAKAHPYIFNQSQSSDPNESTIYHRLFESTIDLEMLKIIKNCTAKDYPGYKTLTYDQNSIDAIYEVYRDGLKNVYNIEIDKPLIKTCLKHFYGIQKFLYNENDNKLNFFLTFEKNVLKKPYAFTSMMVPCHNDIDVLNIKHNSWHHPCTNKTYNTSFPEIFNDSIAPCQELLNAFFNYLKNDIDLDTLLKIVNNRSFETGLSTYQEMKYFDCIYKKVRI